ncbi:MAG: FG-GAP-like repeat-containing protein [Planctomycetota bacterium]
MRRKTYRRWKNRSRNLQRGLEMLENRQLLAAFVVNNLLDGPVSQAGDLPGSLRQAIVDANANPGPDIIEFVGDEFVGDGASASITLTAGELRVIESVEIVGPGADSLTIDGNQSSSIFWFGDENAASTYDVSGFTLTGGNGENGAGIGIAGGAVLFFDEFGSGGDDTLNISNSVIRENAAEVGGGLHSVLGTLNVIDTLVESNNATGTAGNISGGGFALQQTDTTLQNVTIRDNEGARFGGGILNHVTDATGSFGDANLTIQNSTIEDNVARRGGGISNQTTTAQADASLRLTGSTISSNRSTQTGAGINSDAGVVVVSHSLIVGNIGGSAGAGIFAQNSELNIANSTLSGNRSNSNTGGAIRLAGDATVDPDGTGASNTTIVSSTITFNNSGSTGAITSQAGANTVVSVTSQSSIFAGNTGSPNFGVRSEGSGETIFVSAGHNISDDDSGNLAAAGDQINTDPLLLPLADNGGLTLTHALQVDSPAIDAGPIGGRFTDQQVVSDSETNADSVSAADINGDGHIDVISSRGNELVWHQNDGAENFTENLISSFDARVSASIAADLDGDGDVDVISATNFQNGVSNRGVFWHENDGSGNFIRRSVSSAGVVNRVESLFVSDVDGDGDEDILAITNSTSGNNVSVLQNNGSQRFTVRPVGAASFGTTVFAADVDSDGDIDVLTASRNDDKIAWFENLGGLSFQEHVISTSANGGRGVFAIDVDGDGDIDVLSASNQDSKIAWYENDGDENFTEQIISTSDRGAFAVLAADYDGDGDIDVLSSATANGELVLHVNDGSENFTPRRFGSGLSNARRIFTTDIDGDGDLDVLAASSTAGSTVAWFENFGLPTDADGNLLTFDQRGEGFGRILDGAVDVGAFEIDFPDDLIVSTNTDVVDSIFSVGELSLREAIQIANERAGEDTITFDESLDGSTIALGGSELLVTDSLTIDASSLSNPVTIDANGQSRVLRVRPFSADGFEVVAFTINGLNLTGGSTAEGDSGAGIRFDSAGVLTIDNSTVIDNHSGGNGGGISAASSVNVINSVVAQNSSSFDGGGIEIGSGVLNITQSEIRGNVAGDDGGGIHARSTETVITASRLSGNQSIEFGGGLFALSGSVIISGSSIANNESAERSGGGLHLESVAASITDSTVNANSSPAGSGGGINVQSNRGFELINSTVSENTADATGESSNGAGGISIRGTSSVEIPALINSTIVRNSSANPEGAGITVNDTPLRIENSIVAANTADGVAADLQRSGVRRSLAINHSLIGNADNLGEVVGNIDNFFGTLEDPLAPLIADLADNGGPTLTHALLPGSPAINAGSNALAVDADGSPLAFDQRGEGFERIVGSAADIGALELQVNEDPNRVSIRIDNQDAGYLESGGFRASSLPGFADSPSRFSGNPDASVTYSFANLTPGFYRVTFFNVVHPNSTPQARLDIFHNGRTDSEIIDQRDGPRGIIDQRDGPRGIIDLGVHEFTGDGTEQIVLSNFAQLGNLRADAVTLTPVRPPVVLDVTDSEYSEATLFRDSSLTGFNGTSTRFSAAPGASASYDLSGIQPGIYEVSVFVVTNSNSTTAAQYTVNHAGDPRSTTIDQSAGLPGYVSLGIFEFDGTLNQSIEVQKLAFGVLRTDAIILSPMDLTIDNDSPLYSEDFGEFSTSSIAGNQGTESRFSFSPGAQVTYRPGSIAPGNYRLEYFNVATGANTTAAQFEIFHEGRSDFILINSAAAAGGFVSLGEFSFDGSTDEFVRLTNAAGTGALRADAFRWVPIVPSQTLLIDQGTPGYQEEAGIFENSGLRGFEGSTTRFSRSAEASVFYDAGGVSSGTYSLDFFNVTHPSSTTAAQLEITYAAGITIVTLDQSTGESGLVNLGVFTFSGELGQGIRLFNAAGTGILRSDAMLFTPTSSDTNES